MALVQIKVFIDTGEAQIVKAMLEAHGIPAFLFDEHMGGNLYPTVAIFGVRLMVSEIDAGAATRLIADSPGVADDEADEEQ